MDTETHEGSVAQRELARLVTQHGDDLPLDVAAAWLAADEQPGIEVSEMIGDLDELGTGLWIPPGEALVTQIARLNQYVFSELGFHGDRENYDDPRNSCLDYVLEWRRGLPITLAVVYQEIARRVGIAVDGIGFPGHFLVAPRDRESDFFIDVFDGGAVLTRPRLVSVLRARAVPIGVHDRCLEPVTTRAILIRMCRNLEHSWQRRDDPVAVVRSQRRLAILGASTP